MNGFLPRQPAVDPEIDRREVEARSQCGQLRAMPAAFQIALAREWVDAATGEAGTVMRSEDDPLYAGA